MYPKALFVAFLSLALTASAAPKKGSQSATETCAVSVKTVTVTATAAASTGTAVLAANPNAGKGNAGKGNTGKGGNNAGKGGNAANAGQAGNNAAANANAGKGGNNAGQAGNNAGQAGNNAAANANANANAQTSLTIDPSNIFAFTDDGNNPPADNQEASQTSSNNFINFCVLPENKNLQKTNGKQIVEGSCNQTPMGVIAAQAKMPSAKFVFPANGDTVPANQDFTIQLAIKNLETGHFTNAQKTFHMAPQTVNAQGLIRGHSHVTIEPLTEGLGQKTPTDPTKFVFFKGLNDVAQNGILTTVVPGGLPAGTYRIATINSSANHQPALVAVAQRGALDDMAYFTVTNGGGNNGNNAQNGNAANGAQNGNAAAAGQNGNAAAAAGQNGNNGANGAQAGQNAQAAQNAKNAQAAQAARQRAQQQAAAAARARKGQGKNRRTF